MAPEWKFLIC